MYYTAIVEEELVTETKGGDKIKKIKVHYLVKAESVTDAETKVHQQYKNAQINFEVTSISTSKISLVIK